MECDESVYVQHPRGEDASPDMTVLLLLKMLMSPEWQG